MKHEVKVVEFEFGKHRGPDYVAKVLAEHLDEGYTIVGQSESARYLTYTLVKIIPISMTGTVTNVDHQGVSFH